MPPSGVRGAINQKHRVCKFNLIRGGVGDENGAKQIKLIAAEKHADVSKSRVAIGCSFELPCGLILEIDRQHYRQREKGAIFLVEIGG